MDIYSIKNTPIARSYFPIDKDVILEMFSDAGAEIPLDSTVEFTGNTTNGSLIISSIADTTLLLVGQVIEGVGIPIGSKIGDKSASTITLDKLATASDTIVSLTAFTLATPGAIDTNIYTWSFANITSQPESELTGYWKMRTSDASSDPLRSGFQWGGWVDKAGPTVLPFSTNLTQAIPRVKGDNIDFIFDFQEDVTGWQFMFVLVDPNGTFELKKGSANVSGGSSSQISVEASETFSRVIPRILKDETEDFAGTDGNYELQYITSDDKKETVPGVIVFKDELIPSDWAIP